jgi:hypothetical protein
VRVAESAVIPFTTNGLRRWADPPRLARRQDPAVVRQIALHCRRLRFRAAAPWVEPTMTRMSGYPCANSPEEGWPLTLGLRALVGSTDASGKSLRGSMRSARLSPSTCERLRAWIPATSPRADYSSGVRSRSGPRRRCGWAAMSKPLPTTKRSSS